MGRKHFAQRAGLRDSAGGRRGGRLVVGALVGVVGRGWSARGGQRVSHGARARFRNLPVHTTLRVRKEIPSLRRDQLFGEVSEAIGASRRDDFRVVHFSVLGNHLHLIVEAFDHAALARGMQGLGTRIARAVNRVLHRPGGVFADHYHAHYLRSPTEAARAVAYVLGNYEHHFPDASRPARWVDPCSSEVRVHLVARPRLWLLGPAARSRARGGRREVV